MTPPKSSRRGPRLPGYKRFRVGRRRDGFLEPGRELRHPGTGLRSALVFGVPALPARSKESHE